MGLWDWDFVLLPYGERWREKRRLFHSQLSPSSAPEFQSVQLRQAHLFLKELVNHSNQLAVTVRGYVHKLFVKRFC